MKKILLILSLAFSALSEAQNPSYQQKLYYTCKVWGFVKYFHSNVSVCGVNWDSVLIATLPLVKSAVTKNDFNNALDSMLAAAGPMALMSTPRPDTMGPELKRNLNFGWLNDTMLRADVQTILDTIKNNFRPHTQCSVELNYGYDPNAGLLKFQSGDSLIYNANDYTNFADESHRLLELFVHWNIVNYFNPYNYIHTEPWDSALFRNAVSIANATNDEQFYYAFRKVTSQNNDAHTEGLTWDGYCNFPGGYTDWYSLPIILKYIPNQYVVVKSAVAGITNGDAIVSINGLTTQQWEDSLRNYISAGDTAVFRRTMCTDMLYGYYHSPATIVYKDSLNNSHSAVAYYDSSIYNSIWLYSYYPNDTLANVQWRYWGNCNIGYVNVGQMQDSGADVFNMFWALQNASDIIFDIRNYPVSSAIWDLVDNFMYPSPLNYAKYLQPDVTYPGTFVSDTIYMGYNGNPGYNGKIIILFNEETQSAAENCCMILGAMPNVVKIGSQTAGTDGNVTWLYLNQYTETGLTTLGWFYPNGDSTERVGIIPDTIVYPTRAGIRAGRDEVLEKALEVAQCPVLSLPIITKPSDEVTIYPNPNKGIFTIEGTSARMNGSDGQNFVSKIEVYNVLGENIYKEISQAADDKVINLSGQPNGIYFYRITTEDGEMIGSGKFVIE